MSISAVLLALASPLRSRTAAPTLSSEQRNRLKAALEQRGAGVAVTSAGEFLAVYAQPVLALEAALAFQRIADELGGDLPQSAFCGRTVLDVWPAGSEHMPVERLREIMAHTREHAVLLTPEFAQALPEDGVVMTPYAGSSESPALAEVREVAWRDSATTFRESTRLASPEQPGQLYGSVKLIRRDKEVLVYPDDCPFSIGRDHACALTVGGPNVSRLHGAIIHETGKFHFRDDSRNGTYLTSGGEEVFVQREHFPLVSRGVISPGAPLVEQTGDVIRYACVVSRTGKR